MFTLVAHFDASGETFSADGLGITETVELVESIAGQARDWSDGFLATDLVRAADEDDETGEATVVLTGRSGKPITITVTAETPALAPPVWEHPDDYDGPEDFADAWKAYESE